MRFWIGLLVLMVIWVACVGVWVARDTEAGPLGEAVYAPGEAMDAPAEARASLSFSYWDFLPSGDWYQVEYMTYSPGAIEAFEALIAAAEETSDHKCSNRGQVTLRRADGSETVYRVLPGHDPAYYEYRIGQKIYRVPREDFIAVMALIGAKEVPLGRPVTVPAERSNGEE